MVTTEFLHQLLDSLAHPFVFCDLEHTVRYMNRPARAHYRQGAALLGTSVLDCHGAAARARILEVFEELEQGAEERLITDDHRFRIYMRAVRDEDGRLLGYYERYEPPVRGVGAQEPTG